MGDVRSNTHIFLDYSAEYKIEHNGSTDILSLGDFMFMLYFNAGALCKLQAAIDVYLMERHTQSKEDWQTEAVDAEAK